MHTVGARVEKTSGKLTLLRWVALVVGSIIWVGAFNLPSDMSRDAGPGAIVIDWIITGVGVIMLAFVYRGLAAKARPQLWPLSLCRGQEPVLPGSRARGSTKT